MHKMIIGWWILLISRSFPFASMKNPHCSQKGLRFSMTSNLQEDTEYLMLKGCYSTSWLEAFNFLNLLKNPVWVTDTYYLRTNLFFFFSSADSTQETEEISYQFGSCCLRGERAIRYSTKRRNPIRGHRLGVMSTILETQVATKKLKNLQQQNGRNQDGDAGNLSATSLASFLPVDVWGSDTRLVPLASRRSCPNGLD